MLRPIEDHPAAGRFRHQPIQTGPRAPWASSGFLWSLPLLVCLGCASADDGSGGGVGSPCDVDENCESGLVCDIHDGRGSCQEPHEHDDSETGDGGEDGHDHEH